jgi:hypothetical protein
MGAQAAKAPVPMLAGSNRTGSLEHRTAPEIRVHGPVGKVGYTPQVLGKMGPRSRCGGAGDVGRRCG